MVHGWKQIIIIYGIEIKSNDHVLNDGIFHQRMIGINYWFIGLKQIRLTGHILVIIVLV